MSRTFPIPVSSPKAPSGRGKRGGRSVSDSEGDTEYERSRSTPGLEPSKKRKVSTLPEELNERFADADGSLPTPSAQFDSRPADSSLPLVPLSESTSRTDTTLQRGFAVGAIISMRLVNFQVARDATYGFEPRLNIILGSNGTGKSTVVTAMYIMFGGSLSALGRRNYGDFVMHGERTAVISAQLQGRSIDGNYNPTVAMEISTHGTHSRIPQWYINGQSVTQAEMDAFIRRFRIQVNNLCQFLPQFRVAAFSGESPQQRLKSTEEAIGYNGMVEDHETLSSAGAELGDIARDAANLEEIISRLSQRKEELTSKLSQAEAASNDKERTNFLRRVLIVSRHHELERSLDELRNQLSIAQRSLESLDIDTAEERERLDGIRHHIAELEAEYSQSKEASRNSERAFRQRQLEAERNRDRVKDAMRRINAVLQERAILVRQVQKLTKEHDDAAYSVRQSRKKLNELGDTAHFSEMQERYNSLEAVYLEQNNRAQQLRSHFETLQFNLDKILASLSRERARLNETSQKNSRSLNEVPGLLNYEGRKLERAILFVRESQDRFEKPVIEPALMSVGITDKRVLPLFAEVVSLHQMSTFVCQTPEDQRLLMDLASKAGIDIKTTFVDEAQAVKTLSEDVMKVLYERGFKGVLSETLDAPPAMMRFLQSLGLARVPYSLSILPASTRRKMRDLTSAGLNYVDPSAFYQAARSNFGRKQVFETTQKVGSAPRWAHFMLTADNNTELHTVKQRISSLEQNAENTSQALGNVKSDRERLQSQMLPTREELSELKSQLAGFSKYTRRFRDNSAKVERTANEIQMKRQHNNDLNLKISDLSQSLKHALTVIEGTESQTDLLVALVAGRHQRELVETRLRDSRNEFEILSAVLDALRAERRTVVNELEEQLAQRQAPDREEREKYEDAISWLRSHKLLLEGEKEARERPPSQIEDEVGRLTATIALHNQRVDSVESLRQQMRETEEALEEKRRMLDLKIERQQNLQSSVQNIRSRWEAELTTMAQNISRHFSDMFSRLGCQGSVSIPKDDEISVASWGIDINVSFRSGERPAPLSKQRQSGGERAVATAVYLLALQEMAKAPFRVLDEINQGMDESNEKKTMSFFVQQACRGSTMARQYFVVTPKLLLDMPYHKNINVVFITGSPRVGNIDALISSIEESLREKMIEEQAESDDEEGVDQ